MNKPIGQWRCRACKLVWHGSKLYQNPMYTVTVWTCGDLECGGVCDLIPSEVAAQQILHTEPPSACPACGTLLQEAEHDPTCPLFTVE